MARDNYNLQEDVFLIGNVEPQIVGNKLPSKEQVLKLLFFYTRILKYTIRKSSSMVANEVIIFWEKSGIPTKEKQRIIDKIEKLRLEWHVLLKRKGQPSNHQKELDFKQNLSLLFDIAKPDDKLKKLSKDKLQFLTNQRKPERLGFIGDVKSVYDEVSTEKLRAIIEERRKKKYERETFQFGDRADIELVGSSDSNQVDSQISSYSQEVGIPGPSRPKRSRGLINIFSNEKLVATLDKCRVSERNATRIVLAVAEALDYDITMLTLNKSSINDCRKIIRGKMNDKIRERFSTIPLHATILHWDGKLVEEMTQIKKVDRLPIIISDGELEKILSIPSLDNGTGLTQATAIFEVLQDWGISDSIKAVCCDTTPSNLGPKSGAATILEQMLNRELLYLPCRHHIFEVVLGGVFDYLCGPSTGPSIGLFEKFRNTWDDLNKRNFKVGTDNERIAKILENRSDDIEIFINNILMAGAQPRDDYRELLLLCLIFMNKMPREQVKFYKPGSFSRARFMAKAIYCLKIFMFREEFSITAKQCQMLLEICLFVVIVYIKVWFTAPLAVSAPNNDLYFIKSLFDYNEINARVAEVARSKFRRHLWYLGTEAVAMAFFDDRVSQEVKRKMVVKIKDNDNVDGNSCNRVLLKQCFDKDNLLSLKDKDLDHFVDFNSIAFFERFDIDTSFFEIDVSAWDLNESYQTGLKLIQSLKVVNDVAERGVKLMLEYNNRLTNDENQKQYVMQVVENYNKRYKSVAKADLIKPMET